MIYLIYCEQTNTCKIGYSSKPENRLSQLQVGNPFALALVAFMPGEPQDEKLLHEKFKEDRLKGEWFVYSSDIKDYFKVEECFIIYDSFLKILMDSTSVNIKLFAALISRYGDSSHFTMSKSLKEAISVQTGCKVRSLDNALTDLLKKEIIIKIAPQLYRLNPQHVFDGSMTERNKKLYNIKYDRSN